VHFEFNGYRSKTALLFREGDRRPLKFHHLPTDPEIGFPEPWTRGKECGRRSSTGAFGREKSTLSPCIHLPADTAHSRRKSFYCFVINLYGDESETDKNREREKERESKASKGVANSRRRRRRRRQRQRRRHTCDTPPPQDSLE